MFKILNVRALRLLCGFLQEISLSRSEGLSVGYPTVWHETLHYTASDLLLLTCCSSLSSSPSPNLLPSGQRAGASGDRLPGIPVGSHPDQLSSHYRRHPRPVWNNSVQAQICDWGGLNTHVRHADTRTHTHIQKRSLESHFTSSALDLATASH